MTNQTDSGVAENLAMYLFNQFMLYAKDHNVEFMDGVVASVAFSMRVVEFVVEQTGDSRWRDALKEFGAYIPPAAGRFDD